MIARIYQRFSTLLLPYSVTLVALLHIVGIIGLLSPFETYFRLLTPFNLIVCGFVLWINHSENSGGLRWFMLTVFILGFAVEYFGVTYGWIFGEYRYGATLGPKLAGVPVIIGLNWLLIIYCVSVLTDLLPVPLSVKIVSGASLAVLIDTLIEPVAIRYDFWSWDQGFVPLQNYLGWFMVSLVMISLYHLFRVKAENKLALPYYFIQLFFFLVLVVALR